jgi:hypothetical protein
MNGHRERVIGTLRREALDHLLMGTRLMPSASSTPTPATTTTIARTRLESTSRRSRENVQHR